MDYIIQNGELRHHGVKGQRWGVRKKQDSNPDEPRARFTKKPKDLSSEDLNKAIKRLEAEKKYTDLMKSTGRMSTGRGKKFVMDVVESAAKNITTQALTFAFGTVVNLGVKGVAKAIDPDFKMPNIVNPAKGQKDK